jgi:5-carboxymethyl-2-hydroxymuconate isomerase
VAAILKMATSRNFSMSGINSGHHYLPTYQIVMISDNVEFLRIVAAMLQMAISRLFSMSGINSEHHYLSTYQIVMISNNVEFLPPIFYTVFWQSFENGRHLEILKTQNCSSNGDLKLGGVIDICF